MWIHEGFANYAETIYTTCLFGIEAGNDYCIGSRRNTQNDVPIIGPYGVNKEGSGDMYYKGGNLLHMIRQIINDDEKFRQILRGLTSTFYHKTVDSKEVEAYISKNAGKDFSKVFDQYLRTTQIPELEYKMSGNDLSVRWTNCVNGFNMPVKIKWNGVDRWISPTESWVTLTGSTAAEGELQVDRNFYVKVKRGT